MGYAVKVTEQNGRVWVAAVADIYGRPGWPEATAKRVAAEKLAKGAVSAVVYRA